MLTLAFSIQPVRVGTITVPDDYPTIQEAINNATDGDTIYVRAGIYYENVVINKQNLTLIGENKYTTVIDSAGKNVGVSLKGNNVKIKGFTVRNAYYSGIEMRPWTCGHVIHDNIVLNNGYGIAGHYDCINISICHNIITSNNVAGIEMLFSHSTISHNLISENGKGEFQEYSSGIEIVIGVNSEVIYCVNNTISGNTIKNHRIGIWGMHYSEKNLFYHNNFVNNTIQIFSSSNAWNNSVIENYWSDYAGIDNYSGPYQNETGGDGIGDTPYFIDENNVDRYPLMNPWPPTPSPIPIGGYAFPTEGYATTKPLTPYIALLEILIAIFILVKRKTIKKGK